MNSRLTISQVCERMEANPDMVYFCQEIVDATRSYKAAIVHTHLLRKFYKLWKNKSKELSTDGWFHVSNKDLHSDCHIGTHHLFRYTQRLVEIGVLEKKIENMGQGKGKMVYYRFPNIIL